MISATMRNAMVMEQMRKEFERTKQELALIKKQIEELKKELRIRSHA